MVFTVIGGIGALAIAGGMAYFTIQRQRRAANRLEDGATPMAQTANEKSEPGALLRDRTTQLDKPRSPSNMNELDGSEAGCMRNSRVAEIGGDGIFELEGDVISELKGQPAYPAYTQRHVKDGR
jgi:hypothetical protein